MTLFDLASLAKKSEEIEKQINSNGFWNNQREAQKIINKFNTINEEIKTFNSLKEQLNVLEDTYALIKEDYDEEIHHSLSDEIKTLKDNFETFSTEVLLTGDYDNSNAIVDIHPGAC